MPGFMRKFVSSEYGLGLGSVASLVGGLKEPTRVLSVASDPQNGAALCVRPANYPPQSPAMYTLFNAPDGSVVLYYSNDTRPHNIIASARPGALTVRGRQMSCKKSGLSGSIRLETHMGNFKWKADESGSSTLAMQDGAGKTVAKYKSKGMLGAEKQLQIMVQCDDFFVEMALVTALVMKQSASEQNEAAIEVVSALAGA